MSKKYFDYEIPENLNDVQMSSNPPNYTTGKERKRYKEVVKDLTYQEMKYLCSFMWRLGYATAIKETGSKTPEHRRAHGEKKIVN